MSRQYTSSISATTGPSVVPADRRSSSLRSSASQARGRIEPAGSGWHRILLVQEEDGRTYGSLDGVSLGSAPSVGADTIQIHVEGLTAWWDDVIVWDR